MIRSGDESDVNLFETCGCEILLLMNINLVLFNSISLNSFYMLINDNI